MKKFRFKKEDYLYMKRTYAQTFLDRSTTLWNELNAHPSQTDVYGTKLLSVATTCSLLGLKLVADHYLVITDKYRTLSKTSVKPQIKVGHAPNNKVAVSVTVPNHNTHLRKPTIQEVRNAFYGLLDIALSGLWRDGSELKDSQIRFLMRLSGLKDKHAKVVISGFQAMIKDIRNNNDVNNSNKNIQSMCAFLPVILSKMDSSKREMFLKLVERQLSNKLGALSTKEDYCTQIKNLKAPEVIKHLPEPDLPDKLLKDIKGMPAHTFIIVKPNFHYRAVYGRDLITIAKAFIYFMK